MYLSHKDFFSAYKSIRDLYDGDAVFNQLISDDAQEQGKELTEQQVSFYLEEHTFRYLLMNRKLSLRNDFVNAREQWVLIAYPGKLARAQVYLYQKDPLKLNED